MLIRPLTLLSLFAARYAYAADADGAPPLFRDDAAYARYALRLLLFITAAATPPLFYAFSYAATLLCRHAAATLRCRYAMIATLMPLRRHAAAY